MKKKNIILCLLILLPLCIAVGVSTWIILNENKIKTDYKGTDVINKYYDSIQEITYDGDPHYPTLDKLLNFDKVDTSNFKFAYKLTSQPDTTTLIELKDGLINAGEYDIYVRDEVIPTAEANNYDAVIHLSIKKAKLQVIAYDNQITYGDQPQANGVKYVGFVKNENSDVLSGSLSYEYNYSIYGNVGDYTITPKGLSSDNYEITFVSGKLKVNPKSLIFIWSSENPIAKIYDKTHYYPKYNLEGIVNNDAVYADLNINAISGTLVEKYAINKGEYEYSFNKLIGDKCNNYVISNSPENAKLVINPKTITIQWIDSTLTYNGNEQRPEYNISGIIDDDKLNIVLSGLGIDAGNYKCTITINNDNYIFDESSSLSFQYQINKAETVINTEWVPKTFRIVDGEVPIKINGATINHSEGIITYNPEYYPTETGTYDIVISVDETKNYLASSTTITVTITKKPKLILTASDLTTYVYTGKEITASDLKLNATLDGSNYTNFIPIFKYKLENETEYLNNGLPKNANRYKILIYVEETDLYFASDEIEVSCIINKAKPKFTVPIFNSYNTIEGFIPTIKTDATYSIPGTISSNIETTLIYGVASTDNKKVSVTYTFTPTDTDNYNTVSENIEFTLYAVAKRESSYYGTVEQAINVTSTDKNIWVIADVYDKTKLYPIVKSDITINSDVKLILTNNKNDYSTGYKIFKSGDAQENETSGTPDVGAVLYIDDGVTVTTYGTIIIGAYVNYNSSVNSHGVLMNYGTINLESGSNLYAYGYLKGNVNGVVNSKDGSKIWDLFRIYDFPGARYAAGMYYKLYKKSTPTFNNIMPFNCYSFHNISCEINIYKGSTYKARYQLNVSEKIYSGEIEMFGDNGLFKLTTNDGYVNRKVVDTTSTTNVNEKISSSNQDKTQKEVYNTYSDITDNSISISFSFLGLLDIDFQTGKDMAMPIGFMNLNFNGKYTITLKTNSYKFLPGSLVKISSDTKLIIDNGINVIFYDDYYDDYKVTDRNGNVLQVPWANAYCKQHFEIYDGKIVKEDYKTKVIVNGILECTSSGNIGGIIESSENYDISGTLILNNTSATLNRLESIKEYDKSAKDFPSILLGATISGIDFGGVVCSDTVSCYGLQYYGFDSKIQNFSTGTYKSHNGIWYKDYQTISITIFEQDGTKFREFNINMGDIFDPNNYDLSKKFYDLINIYLDQNCTIVYDSSQGCYDNISLFIKFEPTEYTITYNMDNYSSIDNPIKDPVNNTNNIMYYTIETNQVQLFPATNGDYVFDGWYLDSECSTKISQIDGKTLLANGNKNITLYCKWLLDEGSKLKINYFINSPYDDIIYPSYEEFLATLIDSYEISNEISKYNYDVSKQQYFDGWYLDNAFANKLSTLKEAFSNNQTEITLYARWNNKLSITYNYLSEVKNYYYIPGNIELEDFSEDVNIKNTGETIIWFKENLKRSTEYYIGNATISLTDSINLYGELYYVLSETDIASDGSINITGSHKNIIIKDINLSKVTMSLDTPKFSNSDNTFSTVKNGGFYNKGIEKIILDNSNKLLKLPESKYVTNNYDVTTSGGTCGGSTKTTYYCYYYLGLFDSNPLTQVILNNIIANDVPNYIFSNPTNSSFSISSIYSSEVLTLTNAIPNDVTSTIDVNNNGLAGSGETTKVSSLEYTYNKYNVPLYVVISVIMISLLSFVTVTYVKKQKKIRK